MWKGEDPKIASPSAIFRASLAHPPFGAKHSRVVEPIPQPAAQATHSSYNETSDASRRGRVHPSWAVSFSFVLLASPYFLVCVLLRTLVEMKYSGWVAVACLTGVASCMSYAIVATATLLHTDPR